MKLIIVFKKELLDQIRDKRTIIAAILMPALIVPLLLFLIPREALTADPDAPARIIIGVNETNIRNIILSSFKNTQFVDSESPSQAILNGEADCMIEVVRSGGGYSELTIQYDSARSGSALSFARIHDLLDSYLNRSAITRTAFTIRSATVRSDNETRTLLTLSLMLPVFLMVFAASSTISGVIDMTSGEKERSTLETLLSCNVSHTAIILGKALAASAVGCTSVMSLLTGLMICSQAHPAITGGLSLAGFAGATNILLLSVLGALAVFLFASAGMAIGLYSKSVKEGTILALPVVVLGSALSSGLVAGDPFTVKAYYFLIPVVNISYAIRSVIYDRLDALLLLIPLFVTLTYASIFLIISRRLIKNESVIFRS
ncbi:MAG TPA: ABC transporter permease subunit [Spirochaetota bacterium]|nr:ABC transporter permease subunit [Spirochaetota bacterium]